MTLLTFPHITINTLPELTFIARSYKELVFFITNTSGTALNLTYQIVNFTLSPYTNPEYTAFEKQAVCSGGFAKIYLYASETDRLRGKYIQQLILSSIPGYEYKLARGIVNILPTVIEGDS